MYVHFINPTRKFIRWWAPPPHRVLLFVLQSRRKIGCTFWSRERKSLLRLYFSGEIMLRRKMLRIGLGSVQWRNTLELQLFTRLHLRGWLSPAGHKPGRHSFAVMSVPMNRAKGLFSDDTHTFNMDLARGDNTNRRQCGPKRRPILLRPTDPTLGKCCLRPTRQFQSRALWSAAAFAAEPRWSTGWMLLVSDRRRIAIFERRLIPKVQLELPNTKNYNNSREASQRYGDRMVPVS